MQLQLIIFIINTINATRTISNTEQVIHSVKSIQSIQS